jgi:hypothetical protein
MSEWIKSEDRQPEAGVLVLVISRSTTGKSFIGRRRVGDCYGGTDGRLHDLTRCLYRWRPASSAEEALCLARPSRGPELPVENECDTVTNDQGARQSKVIHAMDQIPPDVLLKVAAVLHAGREKYGADNWRKIDQRDHLNHAMVHIVKFMAGDRSESHLVNAICRLMFAEAVGSES